MKGAHSVEKIGGTSMAATATLFDNVLIAGRKGADLYNRIFVVSAYAGMTDLLLEHKKSGKPGVYAQILTNLLLNSHIHAFAEGSEPGIIRIWVRQLLEKWLWLIFEDDGRGMDETTRQRVFEPFFSTRRQHGGTGLGLYICHNLVTNELKGTIDCQSHLGQGTRWIIEHRLSDSASEEEPI